jgi:hypothetical protein
MGGNGEVIKISYGITSLEFDGSVVTLKQPRGTTVIPVQRISSISVPGHLRLRQEMRIVTTDGHVYKFPAAYHRKKVKALRDAVLAAQQHTH